MTERTGWFTWVGLAVVLGAAAVLSFSALAELAVAVRISPRLGWLLPVCTDAGVGVATAVWLGGRHHPDARRFARLLTWALLGLTVAGNAAHQGLAAAQLAPPWWAAVVVGAIPPGVVGAVVHLAVLVGRSQERRTAPLPIPSPASPAEPPDAGDRVAAQPAATSPAEEPVRLHLARTGPPAAERARQLIAKGASQSDLVDALGLKTRYQARQLTEKPERAEELLARWAADT